MFTYLVRAIPEKEVHKCDVDPSTATSKETLNGSKIYLRTNLDDELAGCQHKRWIPMIQS